MQGFVWRIVTLGLVLLAVCASTGAAKPKRATPRVSAHFAGIGTWVFTTAPKQPSKVGPYVSQLRREGYSFAVVAAFNGSSWGLPRRGDQLTRQLVDSFHRAGMRCYGYSTAYFRGARWVGKGTKRHKVAGTNPKAVIANAVKVLHDRAADGVVLDDVFAGANGRDAGLTKAVFGGIRRHINGCSRCRGRKALAFSAFAHHLHQFKWPWQWPIQTCDVYIPQAYILTLNQGRKRAKRMDPSQVLTYSQSIWSALVAYKAQPTRCRFVPALQGYAAVPCPQVKDFLSMIYPAYPGMVVFRNGLVGKDNCGVIVSWGEKFRKPHLVTDPSVAERFRLRAAQGRR